MAFPLRTTRESETPAGSERRCPKVGSSTPRQAVELSAQHYVETDRSYLPPSDIKSSLPSSDIRDQLRKWSINYEEEQSRNAPDTVLPGRSMRLPNSIFIEDPEAFDGDLEQNTTAQELDELLDVQAENKLAPGDLLFMSSAGIKQQYAVFLGSAGVQLHFILADGTWLATQKQKYNTYTLSKWATSEEIAMVYRHLPKKAVQIDRIENGQVVPVQATGDIPYEDSKLLLARFATLHEEIETFRRDHIQDLDRMYDIVADEQYWRSMNHEELTQEVFHQSFETMSAGAKMLLSQYLKGQSAKMHMFRSHYVYDIQIWPKRLARLAENVIKWTRQYQDVAARAATGQAVSSELEANPLTSFIQKARRLILKSRKVRSPTTIGSLGPSLNHKSAEPGIQRIDTGETFSEEDKMIIEYIWVTFLRKPRVATSTMDPGRSIGSLILRAVGAYPRLRLEHKIGRLLLQEMGCLDPWSAPQQGLVLLPLTGHEGSEEAQRLKDGETKALADLHIDENTRGSSTQDFPLKDTLADLRKDWGSLEVLCVDDRSTVIVDDGISLEESKDRPGCYWIHVHVAHPSAFIAPDHPFAARARHMSASFYGVHHVEPYFPWSVASMLGVAPGSQVLTVSSLLTRDGFVEEVQIVPGTVHNVKRLTHSAVHKVLNISQQAQYSLAVGSASKWRVRETDPSCEQSEFDAASKSIETLQLLDRLLRARISARRQEVSEYLRMPMRAKYSNFVRVSDVDDAPRFKRMFESKHCLQDPAIEVSATRSPPRQRWGDDGYDQAQYGLVTAAMGLACESTGRWMKDRNIPGAYIGQFTNPEYPLSKLNALRDDELYIAPTSVMSTKPVFNIYVHAKQYVRVTSPLRRFADLLSAYQIDSYLRSEASGLFSPGSPIKEESQVRFGSATMQDYLDCDVRQAHKISQYKKGQIEHWVYQALFRAFHFNESQLPEVWDVEIDNPTVTSSISASDLDEVTGRILPFGCKVLLRNSDAGWERKAKFRQFVPVKIEYVDPDATEIHCLAIGPASDYPTNVDNSFQTVES